MKNNKLFVIFFKKESGRERLYIKTKALNMVVNYLFIEKSMNDVRSIKELKRIYRKNDKILEIY